MAPQTRATVLLGAAVTLLLSVGSRAADLTAADLAQALQRKYDAVRDFSADFVHESQGTILKKRLIERGKLLVKKPGKMRWEYTTPEEKLFVTDGVKISSYIPQDKQVFISSMPSADTTTTPVLFLAGKGNLTRDFVPSLTAAP